MHDAGVKGFGGTEAGGRVGADRHGGDLERRPVDGAPELTATFGLGHLVAMDLVADGDRADMARLDVAPDGFDVLALAKTHGGDTATVLNARGVGRNGADHGIERGQLVHPQEGRAGIQPLEPDMGRIEAQFLVIGVAEKRHATHPCARRPDHLDGTGVAVDGSRREFGHPAKRRQFDRLVHLDSLIISRWRSAAIRVRRLPIDRRHPLSRCSGRIPSW